MTSAYVIVTGIPSDAEDEVVPGYYEISLSADARPDLSEEIALEIFHRENGIAVLDDFEVRVLNETGEPFVDQYGGDVPAQEAFDLESMGSYRGSLMEGDLPFRIRPLSLGRPGSL